MKQYQIFWRDNDRPVDDYDVLKSGDLKNGALQLWCSDALRVLNFDEVRMIVIKDPS